MVNKLLQTIFDKTYYLVKAVLGENSLYQKGYCQYLAEKYSALLEEFSREEDEDTVRMIVDSYVEDEIRIWSGSNRNEMLSVLDKDPAFEQLRFLSDIAFDRAKKCVRTGEYCSDGGAYMLRLEELAVCLDAIKPHNIEFAKVLLSESLLDIDFSFQKSNLRSFRLARFIE